MTRLEEYYNKFNEDKRLLSRHGQVEFHTTMHYIQHYAKKLKADCEESLRIIDIGAGTGRYSVALAEEGYDVTAEKEKCRCQGISGECIKAEALCRRQL